ATAPVASASAVAAPAVPAAKSKAKLSYKEQRELDELPRKIEALETEHKALEASLASTELYSQGKDKIAAAQARFAQLDEQLLAMMERWEELGKK
ncbi:MAG: ABC transporter ATP-binding protein, partial [Caulobacter sp.]|nr:ABC transporter ATP-binding protein [Vitreoscilla sp.]